MEVFKMKSEEEIKTKITKYENIIDNLKRMEYSAEISFMIIRYYEQIEILNWCLK